MDASRINYEKTADISDYHFTVNLAALFPACHKGCTRRTLCPEWVTATVPLKSKLTLETRTSRLDPQASMLETIEDRVSSIESRVSSIES